MRTYSPKALAFVALLISLAAASPAVHAQSSQTDRRQYTGYEYTGTSIAQAMAVIQFQPVITPRQPIFWAVFVEGGGLGNVATGTMTMTSTRFFGIYSEGRISAYNPSMGGGVYYANLSYFRLATFTCIYGEHYRDGALRYLVVTN